MREWIKREPIINYRDDEPILDKLLKIRGIKNSDEFLNPCKKVLHNSYKLKNIDIVAERIIKAIKQRELISISADVDV